MHSQEGCELQRLLFIVVLHSPGAMEGNITFGLIVDCAHKQVEVINAIATGAAGGPMAALGPLVGRIAGLERRPIRFDSDGLKRSVQAGELLDQACEGIASAVAPGEAITVDNTAHPVNKRLSLAPATRSSLHAFGIDWDDDERHAQRALRAVLLGRLKARLGVPDRARRLSPSPRPCASPPAAAARRCRSAAGRRWSSSCRAAITVSVSR